MSFLKLKFLALTYLFFSLLSNVMANCVDLTGTYKCYPDRFPPPGYYQMTVTQSIAGQNIPVYIMHELDDLISAYAANGRGDYIGIYKTTCDEDKLRIYFEDHSTYGKYGRLMEYHLADNNETLVFNLYDTLENENKPMYLLREIRCERTQS